MSKSLCFLSFCFFFLSSSLYADLSDAYENETTTNPRASDGKKTKKAPVENGNTPINIEKKHKDKPILKNKNDTVEKKKTDAPKKKAPVHFKGLSLTGLKNEGVIELHKQVVVTQDDFKLESEEAKIYSEAPSNNDVKKVVATGHVKITKKDEKTGKPVHANSDVADFDNLTQMITLRGNARILKEGDLLTGDVIYYNLKTGWIKVERVKGIVTP